MAAGIAAAATLATEKGGAMHGLAGKILDHAGKAMKGQTVVPAWVFGKKKGAEPVIISNAWIIAGVGAFAIYMIGRSLGSLDKASFDTVLSKIVDPMNAFGGASNAATDYDKGAAAEPSAPYTVWCWRLTPVSNQKTLLLSQGWNTIAGAEQFGANFGGDGFQVTNVNGQRVKGAPVSWANDRDIAVTTQQR